MVPLFGCALLVVGCAATAPAPPNLPTFRVDEQASEVSAKHSTGSKIPEETAIKARVQAREILEGMVAERADLKDAKPARFKAQFTSDEQIWPMFACLLVLTVFGCPAVIAEEEVRLTFEVDGKRYQGVGVGSSAASIYYNSSRFQSRKEAVQAAVLDALSKGPRETP